MVRIIRGFVVIVFAVSLFYGFTAAAIEVYTFKKDRVDQKVDGNRGYIVGVPPAEERPRDLKRTLIGVDIEVPSVFGPSEKSKKEKAGTKKKAEKPVKATKEKARKAPKAETVVQETVVEQEEEWIK